MSNPKVQPVVMNAAPQRPMSAEQLKDDLENFIKECQDSADANIRAAMEGDASSRSMCYLGGCGSVHGAGVFVVPAPLIPFVRNLIVVYMAELDREPSESTRANVAVDAPGARPWK